MEITTFSRAESSATWSIAIGLSESRKSLESRYGTKGKKVNIDKMVLLYLKARPGNKKQGRVFYPLLPE